MEKNSQNCMQSINSMLRDTLFLDTCIIISNADITDSYRTKVQKLLDSERTVYRPSRVNLELDRKEDTRETSYMYIRKCLSRDGNLNRLPIDEETNHNEKRWLKNIQVLANSKTREETVKLVNNIKRHFKERLRKLKDEIPEIPQNEVDKDVFSKVVNQLNSKLADESDIIIIAESFAHCGYKNIYGDFITIDGNSIIRKKPEIQPLLEGCAVREEGLEVKHLNDCFD